MALPELSKSEYEVLNILWNDSPLGFREVYERMELRWAYTTTKTVMDRMGKKGLLTREKSDGVFVYAPAINRPEGLARMVKFFAENVLGVDSNSVVSMFANKNAMTRKELSELKDLIKKLDD